MFFLTSSTLPTQDGFIFFFSLSNFRSQLVTSSASPSSVYFVYFSFLPKENSPFRQIFWMSFSFLLFSNCFIVVMFAAAIYFVIFRRKFVRRETLLPRKSAFIISGFFFFLFFFFLSRFDQILISNLKFLSFLNIFLYCFPLLEQCLLPLAIFLCFFCFFVCFFISFNKFFFSFDRLLLFF